MKGLLEAAREAALTGGRVVRGAGARGRVASFKGATDLVTRTDRASERAIQRWLKKRFPSHGFLGEEGGWSERGAEYVWIVDPVDGTMNFAHGMPYYDVSVAVAREGKVVAGAVYDPVHDELFSAERGRGAFRNGRRMRVSKRARLQECLVATGFSSALLDASGKARTLAERRARSRSHFRRFEDFCLLARGVRRPGAAALDLAWVAAGIFDGFWEAHLHPWDVAAGWVIVEEAGGRVTDYAGRPADLFGDEIVASNGRIHGEMTGILRGGRRPRRRSS